MATHILGRGCAMGGGSKVVGGGEGGGRVGGE